VQIVGTLNTADSAWMWGWDHPSVPEDLGEHARAVRSTAYPPSTTATSWRGRCRLSRPSRRSASCSPISGRWSRSTGSDSTRTSTRRRRSGASARSELRAAFWRRTDDFHEGGVFGSGNDYAIAELTDWHAAPVHERLWQVTYRRRITPDLAMNEGYLVMLFDDAPQLVDLIEDAD